MATKIYVNLPVKDLQRSMRFFQAMGFGFNPQFSDESVACMVISDDIFAMLLTEAKFREFARRPVADASRMTEVLTCLSVESRRSVNQLVDRALAQGGREVREPEDHGFMFGRSFSDLDGHIWEIVAMDQCATGGADRRAASAHGLAPLRICQLCRSGRPCRMSEIDPAQQGGAGTPGDKIMPQFVIERNMPGVGGASADDLKGASQTSCNVLRDLGPEIQWVHSYVTDDKIYCIYRAPSEDLIREHARQGGFPADSIARVRTVIDPVTAE